MIEKIFAWFRRNKSKAELARQTALALHDGLTDPQFEMVVDRVKAVSTESISGVQKAGRVAQIITDSGFMETHGFPTWIKDSVNMVGVIVSLAYTVAKLTGRIK